MPNTRYCYLRKFIVITTIEFFFWLFIDFIISILSD